MRRGEQTIDKLRPCIVLLLVLALVFPSALFAESESVSRNLKVISSDSEGQALSRPSLLFFDPIYREIYVTDAGNSQLVVYGADYFPKLAIGAGRGIYSAYGSFIQEGLVYACVGATKKDKAHILVLNEALLPVNKIYFTGFDGSADFIPRKLVVAEDGTIYVVSVHSSFVVVLSSDGDYLRTIIPKADSLGVLEKAKIISLAIGKDGRLYFLSEEAGKVFVYSATEKFLYSFGEKGAVAGKLARPRGITLDEKNGRIYIVDYLRHSVPAFTRDGRYLFEIGGRGTGRGWFNYPTDVIIDDLGNVIVSDTFNNRVQVFSISKISNEVTIAESSTSEKKPKMKNRKKPGLKDSATSSQEDVQKTKQTKKSKNGKWVESVAGEESVDF